MANIPQITVLMPVFNGEAFLREAIDSILCQTFTDFELLIINDGSTDQSKEIILSYTDPRIRYIENEHNIKLIATLNKGINLANGNTLHVWMLMISACHSVSRNNLITWKQIFILDY
jgi:glycosyltransferase involved in cell wall biosynthesis